MFESLDLVRVKEVFLLFLIPVGGGIPAGVVLGHKYGFAWPIMTGLYFVSDVVLAFLFEPLTWFFKFLAKRFGFVDRFLLTLRQSMLHTTARYGVKPGPLTLVMISFGVDPMTGRTAALMAGHGFIAGWAIAIAGDLIFFTVIMTSTLWLNSMLGDGTWAAVIVMLGMVFGPSLVRKIRRK